ncbi:MAG: M36 family metallopeptidase, partial [Nocardioidaceae bacterium]
QIKDGLVVAGGWWIRHVDNEGNVTVWDGRRDVSDLNTTEPQLSFSAATTAATSAAKTAVANVGRIKLMVLPQRKRTDSARLVYAVSSADGRGARIQYVDAVTGDLLLTQTSDKKAAARDRDKFGLTGTGRVFDPNPVVKLQDESLRDHRDSATAVPPAGYTIRALRHLNFSHSLRGRWVRIMNHNRVSSPTDTYRFNRREEGFEQVNVYYSVDAEQSYLQRLGFFDVNAESEKIYVNTIPIDNSFYDPSEDSITLGIGGVDDAEDPEVVWHEYGHAIQYDQVVDWGWTRQGGSMGEGFGDYIAVAMSQRTAAGTSVAPAACVMDWDATSYTSGTPHCLRRTDTNKHFPEDLQGEVHADGEIWSGALFDINQSVGRDTATRAILEAHFWMNPRIQMPHAAQITIGIAQRLYHNPAITQKFRTAFENRGIL